MIFVKCQPIILKWFQGITYPFGNGFVFTNTWEQLRVQFDNRR